jgi:hypothetical protein
MRYQRTKLLLTGIAVLFLATGTAHATADGCSVVLKTPDGFLNVRAEPRMGSRILKRLKPGEIIMTDILGGDEHHWERVYLGPTWKDWGWVYYRFIIDVDCDSLTARTTDEGMGPP